MAVFSVPSSLPFHLLSFPTLLLLSVFTTPINALNRYTCQYPTQNPLSGCPPNTLLVGATAKYTTIQSAILSLPHNDYPYNILILPGNYTEQLNITRSGPVTLLGQTAFPTNLTKNSVNVVWHQATGTASTGTLDNAFTSTLTIAPTLNSSLTGSGPTGNTVPADTSFGNSDFRAYNLNFVNDYLPYSAGPSLALSVSYANAGFYYTGFYSYQDTIYIGKLGNAYFSRCEIAGQTDFLYGFGTAWIQSSRLSLRGCGGGITAWKGTNTTWVNKYGVYISESVVEKANSSLSIEGKCALGRPWVSALSISWKGPVMLTPSNVGMSVERPAPVNLLPLLSGRLHRPVRVY